LIIYSNRIATKNAETSLSGLHLKFKGQPKIIDNKLSSTQGLKEEFDGIFTAE